MKKIIWLAGMLTVLAVAGCQKETEEKSPQETLTKFPPPNWKVEAPGRFPASMVAVVALPASLQPNAGDADQLAAFINNECRGVGAFEKVDTNNVYFFLIRGMDSEQNKIVFKYYNAKTAYLYQSEPVISFLIDDVYGNAQTPKVLALTQVK